MIHFACLQCGMKFTAKDEFAGRSTKCPTCKGPVQVPDSGTAAFIPANRIDGSESSLDKAGVNPSVTLAGSVAREPALADAVSKQVGRYVVDREIARGGMGAVLRGIDRDIRREVAIKFMLDDRDAAKKARFVEEAQITGQLEHPNIVPVHELGVDAQKRLFFTMKMVRGRSLGQIVEALGRDAAAEREWPLGRLLGILVNICHALGYAHSRNVIHRDLKPANIMVGDFGEVYVMDWGLAKVMTSGEARERAVELRIAPAQAVIHTSRAGEADLTQDGTIMGTPAYMPPEQAMGHVHALDQRSDIYSLGAILYALLTLKAPVESDGNYMALLMRVVEGQISSPEVRAPRRFIPRELAAIAMKALAKKPGDRYATVEAFRRDLELFLEGRSVSAKPDTLGEQAWKLVKRNKAASAVAVAATLLLALVVGWSSMRLIRAYRDTATANSNLERANENLLAEQEQKNIRTGRAVPAFVRSAHSLASEGRLDDAVTQLDFTLEYDPRNAEAIFLKGQVLIAQKKFAGGRAELERYLEQEPRDPVAQALVKLCAPGFQDNLNFRLALAGVFQQKQAFTLAARILDDKRDDLKAREALLVQYRGTVEKHWGAVGNRLNLAPDGALSASLFDQKQIISLEPLRGMQLNQLGLSGTDIVDLSPLKGMPLTHIYLSGCWKIRDYSPLAGMPLWWADMSRCNISDLSCFKKMRTLQYLNVESTEIEDLSPLEGLPLVALDISVCRRVHDLTPLKGMPLQRLNLWAAPRTTDLRPLAECKNLADLSVRSVPVTDLSPLKGLPIKLLDIWECPVTSLAPLKGMELEQIHWHPRQFKPQDVQMIRDMKSMKTIRFNTTLNYSPADFWKRYDAGEFK